MLTLISCFATLVAIILGLLVFVGLLCARARVERCALEYLKVELRESWSHERAQGDALEEAKRREAHARHSYEDLWRQVGRLEKRLTLANRQLVDRVRERDAALLRLPKGELLTSIPASDEVTRTIPPTTNRALVFGAAIPDDEVTEPSVSASQGASSRDEYTAYAGSLQ